MFEMLTGSRGVTAGKFDELVCAQETLASDISEGLPRASPRLRQAIAQCLAPDPAARPASAHEVSAWLQTVVLDEAFRDHSTLVPARGAVGGRSPDGGRARNGPACKWSRRNHRRADAVDGRRVVAIEIRYPLGWEAVYKGHAIRFRNHPIFGERLYVDGQLVDRGRFVAWDMRGTIEREQAPASASPRTSDRLPPSCHAGSSRNRSHLRRRPLCCLRHAMREFAE